MLYSNHGKRLPNIKRKRLHTIMDDIWEGYSQEELETLDEEWEDFYQYLEEHNNEYETGWE